jgi:hypothetical protein
MLYFTWGIITPSKNYRCKLTMPYEFDNYLRKDIKKYIADEIRNVYLDIRNSSIVMSKFNQCPRVNYLILPVYLDNIRYFAHVKLDTKSKLIDIVIEDKKDFNKNKNYYENVADVLIIPNFNELKFNIDSGY